MEDKITFRFKADIEFFAYDLDDAFARLAQHFANLRQNGPSLQFGGTMDLQPDKAEKVDVTNHERE